MIAVIVTIVNSDSFERIELQSLLVTLMPVPEGVIVTAGLCILSPSLLGHFWAEHYDQRNDTEKMSQRPSLIRRNAATSPRVSAVIP